MHQHKVLCVFIFIIVKCTTSTPTVLQADKMAYYWRDYTGGAVPSDAIPAGTENGSVTYLGQVLFNNLMVPAKIVPLEGSAHFEWGQVGRVQNEDIKVLCTPYPERFEWIRSKRNDFNKIQDKYFVVGGVERKIDAILFFARRKHKQDIVAGKLLTTTIAVLFSEYNGESSETYEFEVLSYKPPSAGSSVKHICGSTNKSLTINLFV